MALAFTIDGTTRYFQVGTLRISRSASGPHRLVCTVRSLDGSVVPRERLPIIVTDGATRLFGGTIDRVKTGGADNAPLTAVDTEIDAIDYNELATREVFSGKLAAGTLKAQLTQLAPFIPGGVTVAADQDDGPTLAESPYYEYVQIDTVLGDIVKAAGGGRIWEIDYSTALRAYTPGSVGHTTPIAVVEGGGVTRGDIHVTREQSNYGNRVVFRFNERAIPAYAFLSHSSNFADTDQVTIGSKTYTFQAVLTDANGNVLVGATLHDSLYNLIQAITLGTGSGTLYAASTTGNTQVTAYYQESTILRVVAQEAGASGNSIGVSSTSAGASWYTEGAIATSTLTFGTDEALTGIAIAKDDTEIGLYGQHTKVVSLAQVITYDLAVTLAQAWLGYYLVVPDTVTFTTRVAGWFPGQSGSVTVASRGIATATFLVTDVNVAHIFGSKTEYGVTMVSSSVIPPSWRDIYRQWAAVSAGGSGTGQSVTNVIGGGSGGGGTTTVTGAAIRFPLGGSRENARVTGAGVFFAVVGANRFNAPFTFAGRVRCDIWARHAGVKVTARLVDETGGTSVDIGDATSTTPVEKILAVTITVGRNYVLYVSSDTADEGVYCTGILESTT